MHNTILKDCLSLEYFSNRKFMRLETAWCLKIQEGGILGNHASRNHPAAAANKHCCMILPTAILTYRDKPVLSGIGRVGLRYSQRFASNNIKWSTCKTRESVCQDKHRWFLFNICLYSQQN